MAEDNFFKELGLSVLGYTQAFGPDPSIARMSQIPGFGQISG